MLEPLVPAINTPAPGASNQPEDDLEYKARRSEIARLAIVHRLGEEAPRIDYYPEENLLWREARQALAPLHAHAACWEYREHAAALALPRDEVPQLAEISSRVEHLAGFRLVPGPGRHDPVSFVEYLAKGVIRCPQFLRPSTCLEFSPQPDLIHGLLGHASALASPVVADLYRLFACRAKKTKSKAELEKLARVYWFTMELGVVREGGDVKAYGAALLSSKAELRALDCAALRPLDLRAMESLELVAQDVQPVLFCARSFDELQRTLGGYLTS